MINKLESLLVNAYDVYQIRWSDGHVLLNVTSQTTYLKLCFSTRNFIR